MSREENLKEIIRLRYRSLRQFAIHTDIPYTTLVTGLDRGITGMGFDTVIKICQELELNPYEV